MKHHFQKYLTHLSTLRIDNLTPDAKADIEKYILERQNSGNKDGTWEFIKYALIIGIVIVIVLCILYSIYQKYKATRIGASPKYDPQGYGGYQQNYPVMAGAAEMQGLQGMGYGGVQGGMPGGFQLGMPQMGYQNYQPQYNKQQKRKARQHPDFAQSLTWRLQTQGKAR